MSVSIHKQKILALILAGGKGSRLGLLTENRAKPVMPFAGNYRLIDFALSNCRNSQINDVWVIEQYELHSLNEHLANGRPWDLDRTYGGLQVLPPFEDDDKSSDEGSFAQGNADAIARHKSLIREFNPDILITLSADHIYKFDFRDAVETHLEKQAAVTMVTTKLPATEKDASRFGVVETAKNGRVVNFEYKPENPKSDVITTEIFVYDGKILLDTINRLQDRDGKLKDYGNELIPHFVKNKKAFEHRLDGFWRDVGTIESYWETQMNLLDGKNNLKLGDENWRILTQTKSTACAFISNSAKIADSLIADGTHVSGTVKKSILSAGVIIEKGAEVEECVIMSGAIIEKGVKLKRAIIDADTRVTAAKIKLKKRSKSDILVVGQRKIQTSTEISDEANKDLFF